MNDIELLEFIDWYNVMHEELRHMNSDEIKNMYFYYLNNKL
jgi:hypothetical protein